jgi:hypothetical protein
MKDRFAGLLLVVAVALFISFEQPGMAQEPLKAPSVPMPLTNSPSAYNTMPPLTIPQQRAKFEADQRMLRMEWNNWIGYSPSRPNMNASYMSNGLQQYYIPSRGVIVSTGHSRSWYW